jgi:hypothetical protein
MAPGDTVNADMSSFDTITLGNGARDVVSAVNSSYDTIVSAMAPVT